MTTTDTHQSDAGFYGLGIAPKLLQALDSLKFKVPTPIQHKAIPVAATGADMVGIAQTGTGKTIAFMIPMIQRLAARPGKGLVLVPTRELALQVADVSRQFAPLMGFKLAVLIGGESAGRQLQTLRENPRIIVATPGRLIDHIGQRNVNLSDVSVLVLDEADRMFDMGFAPQIERVIAVTPKDRQTMLFSATMPDEIMKLAGKHMKLPLRVEVAPPGTAAEKVRQELFVVQRESKLALLGKLLEKHSGSVLLFVRTKHNAKKIAKSIREMSHSAAEIHSNRSLNQRREALEGFKTGKYRILVATDIAARGIDVTGIELVVNYDLPDEDGNYVHRIGRTGRAGRPGHAITFAAPDQGNDVRNIEKLIRMPLTRSEMPGLAPVKFGEPVSGPRPPGEKRLPGTRQPEPRREQHPRAGASAPRHGRPQPAGRRDDRRPDPRGPRPPARSGGRGEARRDRWGGSRSERPGRSSIVSPSPYFDDPPRRRRPPEDRNRPFPAAEKPKQEAGWFSRFLRKRPE